LATIVLSVVEASFCIRLLSAVQTPKRDEIFNPSSSDGYDFDALRALAEKDAEKKKKEAAPILKSPTRIPGKSSLAPPLPLDISKINPSILAMHAAMATTTRLR